MSAGVAVTHGTRDAAFIAASRTLVPALVAEVRACREFLASIADCEPDDWTQVSGWAADFLNDPKRIEKP